MALEWWFLDMQAPSPRLGDFSARASFAGMGAGSQNIVSTLINGLQLVQTITGFERTDQSRRHGLQELR